MDLLKAIRTGNLSEVKALLDGGASLDGEGESGLAMGMACFVAALQGGTTLLAAAGQACAIDQGFDLPLTLAMLMRWHLLTDLSYGDTPQ